MLVNILVSSCLVLCGILAFAMNRSALWGSTGLDRPLVQAFRDWEVTFNVD
jgi:hypothetical protein